MRRHDEPAQAVVATWRDALFFACMRESLSTSTFWGRKRAHRQDGSRQVAAKKCLLHRLRRRQRRPLTLKPLHWPRRHRMQRPPLVLTRCWSRWSATCVRHSNMQEPARGRSMRPLAALTSRSTQRRPFCRRTRPPHPAGRRWCRRRSARLVRLPVYRPRVGCLGRREAATVDVSLATAARRGRTVPSRSSLSPVGVTAEPRGSACCMGSRRRSAPRTTLIRASRPTRPPSPRATRAWSGAVAASIVATRCAPPRGRRRLCSCAASARMASPRATGSTRGSPPVALAPALAACGHPRPWTRSSRATPRMSASASAWECTVER